MIGNSNSWIKLGRVLKPDATLDWMSTYTGASFALETEDTDVYNLFVTGRDIKNRSQIGKIKIEIKDSVKVLEKANNTVLPLGELGAFDENGVSYPYIVRDNGQLYMYYVGWMPTVLAPFQNHTGLAKCSIGENYFERVSRAPILPRNNEEPFGTGSVCVIKENNIWKMWYTVWKRWGSNPTDFKHYYIIRYAESSNGIDWKRFSNNCIDFKNEKEYAIARPSVIKIDQTYHMWYVYRGEQYRIGYAHSEDGYHWTRRDDLVGLDVSDSGWDSKAISYPHVVRTHDRLLMFYCGNNYGQDGLGVATLVL